MPNINKCIQAGHLTRDPELSYLPNQTPLCSGGIAVDSGYGDKARTCFIDFVIFGKRAEAFNKYMAKGKPVMLESELSLDQWTDKQGNKRSKHKLIVNDWHFLEAGKTDDQPKPGPKTPLIPDDQCPF